MMFVGELRQIGVLGTETNGRRILVWWESNEEVGERKVGNNEIGWM